MNQVDARGLACPGPVISTKKALDAIAEGHVEVLVDNEIARDNVLKLARSSGWDSSFRPVQGGYAVNITKKTVSTVSGLESMLGTRKDGPLVVLITSHLFGRGDEELGRILMRSFLVSLSELDREIRAVLLMNSGVFLSTRGSEVAEYLKALESRGTQILSCGTCLDYYGRKDQLVAGSVTNMYSALDTMTLEGVRTLTV